MKEVKTPIGEDHALAAPLQVRHNLKRPLESQDFFYTHTGYSNMQDLGYCLERGSVIPSEDSMILRFATMYENARSALDCGSKAAALKSKRKGGNCPLSDASVLP
jgi:hypothetical protein